MSEGRLKELAKLIVELKDKREAAERQAKSLKAEEDQAKECLLRIMETLELESFKAQGFNFFPVNESRVSMPKEQADKQKLFSFLEEKGVLQDYLTINSQSLNSLFKTYSAEAVENGVFDFNLPGVKEPFIQTVMRMRKA